MIEICNEIMYSLGVLTAILEMKTNTEFDNPRNLGNRSYIMRELTRQTKILAQEKLRGEKYTKTPLSNVALQTIDILTLKYLGIKGISDEVLLTILRVIQRVIKISTENPNNATNILRIFNEVLRNDKSTIKIKIFWLRLKRLNNIEPNISKDELKILLTR